MSDRFSPLSSALAARYRIERELGQGSMATVYLAQDGARLLEPERISRRSRSNG